MAQFDSNPHAHSVHQPVALAPRPPRLRATGLTKQFGSVCAVNDVHLTVDDGEVVGLLGPNGAGKTTTLRLLAGILSPDRGQVHLGRLNLAEHELEAKSRIGFLSGDTQLYQRLTPREVLRYFGRLYQMDPARLEERIESLVIQLDMGSYAGRLCRTLSSGQRQRANIARAFLHQPDLLVLDEPTAALDVISGQFIVESIRREAALGRAVLLSTHIMGEAEYLCDRIYLMHQGGIVDYGTVPEILARSGQANLTDAFLHYAKQAPVPAGDQPNRAPAE